MGCISTLYHSTKKICHNITSIAILTTFILNWGHHPLVIPNLIKDSSVLSNPHQLRCSSLAWTIAVPSLCCISPLSEWTIWHPVSNSTERDLFVFLTTPPFQEWLLPLKLKKTPKMICGTGPYWSKVTHALDLMGHIFIPLHQPLPSIFAESLSHDGVNLKK